MRMQAAATTCYVAAHPRVAGVSGRYFADCNEALPSPAATDRHEAARLWRVSEAMIDGCTSTGQPQQDGPDTDTVTGRSFFVASSSSLLIEC
jgi:retinol dehydrogenase-12